jgi:hypothetical protein
VPKIQDLRRREMPAIEILHTEGCLALDDTVTRARDVIARLAPDSSLTVTDASVDASALDRYSGSPTIRVDEVDLEPETPAAFWAG